MFVIPVYKMCFRYCYFKEKEQAHSQDNVTQQRWLLLSFQLLANCGLLMVDRILSISLFLLGSYLLWFSSWPMMTTMFLICY